MNILILLIELLLFLFEIYCGEVMYIYIVIYGYV